MTTNDTPDEQNARYLANPRQCIQCAGPPAAGMPRCLTCHHKHIHCQEDT